MAKPRLVSSERAEVLLEVLTGPMEPIGINPEWKSHFVETLSTLIQTQVDLDEAERAKERMRKDVLAARESLVGSLAMVRRVIDGIERESGDRKAKSNPRVPIWKCECQGGEGPTCKDRIHTAIVPGTAQGVQDEDPGHFYEDKFRSR